MNKILLVNLGCPKNQKDGETALSILLLNGFTITKKAEEADLILVNTCSFIDDAKQESISEILNYAEYKKNGSCKALFVMGCLSQLYAKDLQLDLPEVDVFIGVSAFHEIFDIYDKFISDEKKQIIVSKPRLIETVCNYQSMDKQGFVPETGIYSSYLKISEGCNNNCSYCIIPTIRGSLSYRNIDAVINETKVLVQRGIKEIVLIAQDLTADIKYLKDLLKKMISLPIEYRPYWIRLMYCNPWGLDDELIELIKNEENIVNYIDMPIQHISDNVLKAMNRRTSSKMIKGITEKLTNAAISIRTTVMTGFPGETEKDFELLKNYISEGAFHWMGIFPFSPQEGTVASSIPSLVEKKVAIERRNELDRIQFDITNLNNNGHVGKTYTALFDRNDGNKINARFYFQAPVIDGVVVCSGKLKDSIFKIEIEDTNGIDLFGRLI